MALTDSPQIINRTRRVKGIHSGTHGFRYLGEINASQREA
jgi:hypothetical protein